MKGQASEILWSMKILMKGPKWQKTNKMPIRSMGLYNKSLVVFFRIRYPLKRAWYKKWRTPRIRSNGKVMSTVVRWRCLVEMRRSGITRAVFPCRMARVALKARWKRQVVNSSKGQRLVCCWLSRCPYSRSSSRSSYSTASTLPLRFRTSESQIHKSRKSHARWWRTRPRTLSISSRTASGERCLHKDWFWGKRKKIRRRQCSHRYIQGWRIWHRFNSVWLSPKSSEVVDRSRRIGSVQRALPSLLVKGVADLKALGALGILWASCCSCRVDLGPSQVLSIKRPPQLRPPPRVANLDLSRPPRGHQGPPCQVAQIKNRCQEITDSLATSPKPGHLWSEMKQSQEAIRKAHKESWIHK